MPEPRNKDQSSRDPGAYIGRLPERTTQTIPGGVGRKDRRSSGVATHSAPARGPAPQATRSRTPEGHRESDGNADAPREAGESR